MRTWRSWCVCVWRQRRSVGAATAAAAFHRRLFHSGAYRDVLGCAHLLGSLSASLSLSRLMVHSSNWRHECLHADGGTAHSGDGVFYFLVRARVCVCESSVIACHGRRLLLCGVSGTVAAQQLTASRSMCVGGGMNTDADFLSPNCVWRTTKAAAPRTGRTHSTVRS